MPTLLEQLLAVAQEPAPRLKKKDRTERFTRDRDEVEELAEARYSPDFERIELEDQTLINGLPAEEVITSYHSGDCPDDLVAEVVSGVYMIRKKDETLKETWSYRHAYPEFSPDPLHWELKG